jgi:peptidyl-prolyl cis-trans isomerase D
MLEAIRERAQGWLAKVILGLIVVSFALFGVDTYFKSGGGEWVAKIDGEKVAREEYARVLRDESDRLRGQPGFDPAMLDTPEARRQILDRVINERVLLSEAVEQGMMAPDAKVAAVINQIPAFQDNGTFSRERYVNLLRRQGLSEAGFEARIRQSLLLQDAAGTLGDSAFAMPAMVARLFGVLGERREVRVVGFRPEAYLAQATLADGAARAYYDQHPKDYEAPERVRVEYVRLDPQALAADVAIPDADIQAHYQANLARYSEPEQRRASHILITANAADPTALKQARARAEALLKQVQASPASFGQLAREHSQDPGSAARGGDLDWFPRGLMVKPFEDAVFAMREGEIRGPVQSDFGFHIIRLLAAQPGRARALADVRAEIADELRARQASRRFAESAEQFGNLVYEQSDSLKPVAEALKLSVHVTDWMSRAAPDPALNHKELLAAVFARESLAERRNTEAFEVAPQTLVAARVVEHHPARARAFEEVKEQVEAKLRREQAARLAAQAGAAFMERARQGTEVSGWSAPQVLSRDQPGVLPKELSQAVFRLSAARLPAYVSGAVGDGSFVVARLERVARPTTMDPATARQLAATLQAVRGQEDTSAHLALLKGRADIEIDQSALEKKDN